MLSSAPLSPKPPLWQDTQPVWLPTLDTAPTSDPDKSNEQATAAVDADFFPPSEWSTQGDRFSVPSAAQSPPGTEGDQVPPVPPPEVSADGAQPEAAPAAPSSEAALPIQASSPGELFHRVPLGEKGRMELKSAIRAAIKERPELRERVNAVAKLRCATIPQLLKIASICNLWSMALNISRRFMETRNGKQARTSRRDAASLLTPTPADLRRVRPSAKVRRPTMPAVEGPASPASPTCPLATPVAGQQGEWDAGACWTAYDAVQNWISAPSWVSSVPYSLADLGGTVPAPTPEPASADVSFPAWNMTSY